MVMVLVENTLPVEKTGAFNFHPFKITIGAFMNTDVALNISGAAGQGIQTIGDLLCDVCHQSGLFIFSVDDFESRIRGGTQFQSAADQRQSTFRSRQQA